MTTPPLTLGSVYRDHHGAEWTICGAAMTGVKVSREGVRLPQYVNTEDLAREWVFVRTPEVEGA